MINNDLGNSRRTAIIVPVYADWRSLRKNLKSLKSYYSNVRNVDVYYVNDCGPDADNLEIKIKKSIDELKNFHYRRNKSNLGFVKNCNNAVENIVPKSCDILLLNSDTVVTEGFLEEMLRVLYSQDDICAVNPRSNNATVWSVPSDGSLAGKPKKSYRQWLSLKKRIPFRYISPTAHGFCMLIKRSVINNIGLFDPVFGKGYGEENDFTMRARKNNMVCAVANHAYVYHIGSRSFGNSMRTELSSKNTETLLKRYPQYTSLVSKYVEEHQEPKVIRRNGLFYRMFRIFVRAIEYGYTNGYVNTLRHGSNDLKRRLNKRPSRSEPSIHVWSHEITNSGAPIVLFDILNHWKNQIGIPTGTTFNYPTGARVEDGLRQELKGNGIQFKPKKPTDLEFIPGDKVVFNSTALPDWLYQATITGLQNGTIDKLYFYIHEDDETTTGSTNNFKYELCNLIKQGKVLVYTPSKASSRNWRKYFGSKKGIYAMPGHVTFHPGMFNAIPKENFDVVNFVVTGAREPRKGILDTIDAIQTVDKYHIRNDPETYRDFTLTIVGNDYNNDFYNRFIRDKASFFGKKINLVGKSTQSEVFALLQKSNFSITYSIADSLSMSTLEGMAFGHPIIRSGASGLEEQLIPGKNGWLARTTNWGELVDAMEAVLSKKKTTNEALAKMSKASVKIARKNYDSEYIIINDLIKGSS